MPKISGFHPWMAVAIIVSFTSRCMPDEPSRSPIIIAVAANAQFALAELADTFLIRYQQPVQMVTGSSGKLATQINQGAPYALFVAADRSYAEAVAGQSKVVPYAFGTLVLWSNKPDLVPDTTADFLMQSGVYRIALANPKNAPYGQEAVHYLRHLGLYDTLSPKLVYGESIAQTNQYIESGAADVGLTARSAVMMTSPQAEKWVPLPDDAYQPIEQCATITPYGRQHQHEKAHQFLQFLLSDTGQNILEKWGYQPIKIKEEPPQY